MTKLISFCGFLLLFAVACTNNTPAENAETDSTEMTEENAEATEATEAEVDMTGPEYTSAYVCPMHCKGSGSAEPGNCPECGMAYVANEDMNMEEGEHDHDHKDHEH